MTRLLLAGAAALAMTLAVAGARAEPPPMAQVAPPAPVDPATLDLAHRYLESVHFTQMLQKMTDQLLPATIGSMMRNAAGVTAEQKSAMVSALQETMHDFMPRFEDKAAETISAGYTHEELQALVDFYESPIGLRIAAKSLDMQQVQSQAVQSLAPQMMRDMFHRICAKTACPPGMKALIPNES